MELPVFDLPVLHVSGLCRVFFGDKEYLTDDGRDALIAEGVRCRSLLAERGMQLKVHQQRAEKAEQQVKELSAELAGHVARASVHDRFVADLQEHRDADARTISKQNYRISDLENALERVQHIVKENAELRGAQHICTCDLEIRRQERSLRTALDIERANTRSLSEALEQHVKVAAELTAALDTANHERDDYRQALETERAGTRSLPLIQAINSIRDRAAYNRKRGEEAEKTDPELSVRKYVRAETLESVVHLLEAVTPEQPKVCPNHHAAGTVEALKEACRLIFGREPKVTDWTSGSECKATLNDFACQLQCSAIGRSEAEAITRVMEMFLRKSLERSDPATDDRVIPAGYLIACDGSYYTTVSAVLVDKPVRFDRKREP